MGLTATPYLAVNHAPELHAGGQGIFCDGPLSVDGATELDGNVNMNGTLTVDGASTLTGAVAMTGRLTTTDGVASGTARTVGGLAYNAVSAADDLLASAGASAHVDHAQTYSIPASTLKAGTLVKIKYLVRTTNVDGTDTLETKLYLGATTLMTTTAFDPSATTDFAYGEFVLVVREAPSADSSICGYGHWVTSDTGTEIRDNVALAPADFATNGALVIKVSSKWSSTTALTNANLALFIVEIV